MHAPTPGISSRTTCAIVSALTLMCLLFSAGAGHAQDYTILQVTDDQAYSYAPHVSDGQVVWVSFDFVESAICLFNGEEILKLTAAGRYGDNPRIHQGQVVWEDYDLSEYDSEIYLYNGADVIRLTDNNDNESCPSIDNGQVAWVSRRSSGAAVFLYDGVDTVELASNPYFVDATHIHGGQVVWRGYDGQDSEIYLYDGADVLQLTDNQNTDDSPRIHNGRVVWVNRGSAGPEIHLYDGAGVRTLGLGDKPKIHNGQVVWKRSMGQGHEIFLYDGVDIRQLTNDGTVKYLPQIHGGEVVWQSFDGYSHDVFLYNGDQVSPLTADSYNNSRPQIHNGHIVWIGAVDADAEIFMAIPEPQAQLVSLSPDVDTVCLGAEIEFQAETEPAGFYDLVSVTVEGAAVVCPYDASTGRLTVRFDGLSVDDTDLKSVTATLGEDALALEIVVVPLDTLRVAPRCAVLAPGGIQAFVAEGWHRGPDGRKRTADDLGPFPVAVTWKINRPSVGSLSPATGPVTILTASDMSGKRGWIRMGLITATPVIESSRRKTARALVAVVRPRTNFGRRIRRRRRCRRK